MFAFGVFPIAAGSLATGGVFSAMNIGMARNPDETPALFNNSMVAFALIETFIFVGVVFCASVSILN
jgi:F0F1-type ATP synthase membrane subunit c/vacuolar-type H+-ATPase subunit K